MRHCIAKCLLIGSVVLPLVAASQTPAQVVLVRDKPFSTITAHVAALDKFEVTDDKGGWFGGGLAMQQTGGLNSPYEVEARLKVVSTKGAFQVHLDGPLQIVNQADPSLVFQSPTITLAGDGGARVPLEIGNEKKFTNPPAAANTDSVGYYTLTVSALPPAGGLKSTVGSYVGVLSLTFEPQVR